jgi:Dihydroorotase and related cyclic amidohydrolases
VTADLVIANGEVVTPAGRRLADVVVRDGRIAELAEPGTASAAERIDARGLWVLPGMVDLHVHFRDPGKPHVETFATGTAAAAHGGVTTVADMPNTTPPLLTVEELDERLARASATASVDFTFWAGAPRTEEFAGFGERGIAGVKVFLAGRAQGAQYGGGIGISDDEHLLDVFAESRRHGLTVAVHLSNPSIEHGWRRDWVGRGIAELRDEVVGESRLDKIESAQRVLLFAEHTGARIHLVHVSAAILPLIRDARARGVRVTAESFAPFVSTEQFDVLGELGYDRYRRPDEIEALWAGMRDGSIDSLASDHAPHARADKDLGRTDLLASSSGYPELDTILPMMLDRVLDGVLSLERLVELYAATPAAIAGLDDRKGALEVGRDADVVLVDPRGEWVVRAEECRSRAGWTPFEGRRLRGRIEHVLLRGRPVDPNAPQGVFQPRQPQRAADDPRRSPA